MLHLEIKHPAFALALQVLVKLLWVCAGIFVVVFCVQIGGWLLAGPIALLFLSVVVPRVAELLAWAVGSKMVWVLILILCCAFLLWAWLVGSQRADVKREAECRQLSVALDEVDRRHAYTANDLLMEEWRWKCSNR
jgi:energy-coupling factor transporter transmembrane protein EcfT